MILRTKTFGSPKEKYHTFPKGALTTARPLLVNARLTGETCAKNFADTCYTASGPRAGSLSDKVQHKRKMNEWVTECATHIFPSKNQEFTHPENMFLSFYLDGWSVPRRALGNVRF